MNWSDYLAHRAHRAERALHAAGALERADPQAALDLLHSWAWSDDTRRAEGFLRHLLERTPDPPRPCLAALFAPAERLPPSDRPHASANAHDLALVERLRDTDHEPSPRHALAWALDELAVLGHAVERRQRVPWTAATYDSRPERDAATLEAWRGWFDGNPWPHRAVWDELHLPRASRAFAHVLAARDVPPMVRRRALEDFPEAWFFLLLGTSDAAPGWRQIAARVIETDPRGPVTALAATLDPRSRQTAAQCAVNRGNGPATAALVYREQSDRVAYARAFHRDCAANEAAIERLLDLHVCFRLIDRWAAPGRVWRERSWNVVVQNRGRARGRLRALLAGGDPSPLRAVVTLDSLYERTATAVERFCRDWAWQQVSLGFSFYGGHLVDPACVGGAGRVTPFTPTERDALSAWVLLAVVKGRLAHLERWVANGRTGDRDSVWGRLLSEELPASLRSSDAAEPARAGLKRVRAELAETLPSLLTALAPTVERLGALQSHDSDIERAFVATVRDAWHDEVRLPRVRYRRYIENAAMAAVDLRERR